MALPKDLVNKLAAFVETCDQESYARAADRLGVTAVGVSSRVRALEEEAGTPLFRGTNRGVIPTPAARRLYVYATNLLAQARSIELLLAESGGEPPIRIAVSHTMAEFVLPAALVEFEIKHKEEHRLHRLSLEMVIGNSLRVRAEVASGRVDLGIGVSEGPPTGSRPLTESPFCEDEVVLLVPKGHRWANIPEVPLDDFIRTPLIMRDPESNTRRTVERVLAERGKVLHEPLAEVGSTIVAKKSAQRINAPALLSAFAIGTDNLDMVVRRVAGVPFKRNFVIMVRNPDAVSPTSRKLIEHLISSPSGLQAAANREKTPPRSGPARLPEES